MNATVVPIPTIEELDCDTIQKSILKQQAILIDVRETHEYELEHIPGSLLVPLSCLEPERFPHFEAKILVIHCAIGIRSAVAVKQLLMAGYPYKVVNMIGGIEAWKIAGFETGE